MKQTILKYYRKTLWSRQQPVRRMPDASSTEVAEEYSTTSVESAAPLFQRGTGRPWCPYRVNPLPPLSFPGPTGESRKCEKIPRKPNGGGVLVILSPVKNVGTAPRTIRRKRPFPYASGGNPLNLKKATSSTKGYSRR